MKCSTNVTISQEKHLYCDCLKYSFWTCLTLSILNETKLARCVLPYFYAVDFCNYSDFADSHFAPFLTWKDSKFNLSVKRMKSDGGKTIIKGIDRPQSAVLFLMRRFIGY